MGTKAPTPSKEKKRDGMLTSVPSSARKRLKQYQDAIRSSKKGMWRPGPSLHDFGEKFYSTLVGIKHREIKEKSGGTLNGFSLVFNYVADNDASDAAKKADGKQWQGRTYTDRIYVDPKTKEEKCFDFADLKAVASLLCGEEIEDGDVAIETIIAAAKDKPMLEVSLKERPNNKGGDPFIEEVIHRVSSSSESSDDEDDDDDDTDNEDLDDDDAEDQDDSEDDADDDDDDDDEEAAPPPPKKKKK